MNSCGMVVNWLTADQTIRAVKSIHKYYPKMLVYIVDDGSDPKDKGEFNSVYKDTADIVYDPDTLKLKNIPNTKFIGLNHHMRHGESIDYAASVVKTQGWILHLDSDARLIKGGVVEKMLDGVTDRICQIGIQKIQKSGFPHIANPCMMFRLDLCYRYAASFKPIYELGLEAGHRYVKTLMDYNYSVSYSNISDYFIHLRTSNKELWEKYY